MLEVPAATRATRWARCRCSTQSRWPPSADSASRQVFERLCQLLFTTAPESLQRLGAALEAGDLEAIARAAHSLKSPVNSLGGRRLAEQLERCELAAIETRDLKAARRAARRHRSRPTRTWKRP